MNRRTFITALGVAATHHKLSERPSQLAWENFGLDSASPIVTTARYPYIQNARSDRVSILWATLESGAGAVEYSSDGINFNRVGARKRLFTASEAGTANDFVQYQANITNLQPSTNYVYRVSVNGGDVTPGGETRFRTAGPGPFNFVVLGDSGWD